MLGWLDWGLGVTEEVSSGAKSSKSKEHEHWLEKNLILGYRDEFLLSPFPPPLSTLLALEPEAEVPAEPEIPLEPEVDSAPEVHLPHTSAVRL